MSIDRKEVERILDDIETKSEHYEDLSEKCKANGGHNSSNLFLGRSIGLDYAAAVLRQVLHG